MLISNKFSQIAIIIIIIIFTTHTGHTVWRKTYTDHAAVGLTRVQLTAKITKRACLTMKTTEWAYFNKLVGVVSRNIRPRLFER